MMHIHIDMLGGIAGDMFLAASIDSGLVQVDDLQKALSSLGVGEIRIVPEKVRRGALSGTHVHFSGWDPAEERDHRHLSAILEMLDESGLEEPVRERAKQMFRTLGASESKVHDIPIERVHFHECGALDSIFDFVSAAFIIETCEASWSFGAVPTGSGTVTTDHGVVPVPVPATAEILEGFELVPRQVAAELVTPTGATILKTLREGGSRGACMGPRGPHKTPKSHQNTNFSTTPPAGTVRRVGYGAGTRELAELANVVRFLVLDVSDGLDGLEEESEGGGLRRGEGAPGWERGLVTRLSCDIDDMNPEWFPELEDRLLEAGAVDVTREAIWMKKGRQGTRLSVLCRADMREDLAALLFRHTTTFGLRVEELERFELRREMVQVQTSVGAVCVKLGYLADELVQAAPEHEDCARLAAEHGVPIRRIYEEARSAAKG